MAAHVHAKVIWGRARPTPEENLEENMQLSVLWCIF